MNFIVHLAQLQNLLGRTEIGSAHLDLLELKTIGPECDVWLIVVWTVVKEGDHAGGSKWVSVMSRHMLLAIIRLPTQLTLRH